MKFQVGLLFQTRRRTGIIVREHQVLQRESSEREESGLKLFSRDAELLSLAASTLGQFPEPLPSQTHLLQLPPNVRTCSSSPPDCDCMESDDGALWPPIDATGCPSNDCYRRSSGIFDCYCAGPPRFMATLERKQAVEEWPENPSSANSARGTCSNTFASATRAPGDYSAKLARVQGDRLKSADSVSRLLPGCSGSPVTISQESPLDTPTTVSWAQGNPPGNPDSPSRDAGNCPESEAVVQKDIPSIAASLTKPQAGCLDSPASTVSNDGPDGRILVSSDRDINLDRPISGIIARADLVPKSMLQGNCRGNLPSVGIIPSGCQTSYSDRDLRNAVVTSILSLERLEVDLYRGTHHWIPRSRILYGGQIVGQALVAAAMSVPENLLVHSLHCYFVRTGDPNVPVLYQVDHIRDGKSFSVHCVKAIQHGQLILICQASFHKKIESPIQHQFTMPVVPAPEDVLTEGELIEIASRDPDLTEKFKKGLPKILEDIPIEIKPINQLDYYKRESKEPVQCFWVRACGYIGEGNMKLHCGIAAYMSDYAFLKTALLPHAQYRLNFMASLDHSMWFHAPFRSDEWMLFECESPWSGGCRGLVQGRLWKQNGVLAVSCAQEGVFYVKPNPAGSKL